MILRAFFGFLALTHLLGAAALVWFCWDALLSGNIVIGIAGFAVVYILVVAASDHFKNMERSK